jgi:hypothetical protein
MLFRISNHAQEEMKRRSIPGKILDMILNDPQQIVPERGNLKAYPSVVDFGDDKQFLMRAIVDDTLEPAIVVTVYRISKISKYWRRS